jgi:glutaredoxin
MGRASRILGPLIALCICSGCGEEKPPAPDKPPSAAQAGEAREDAVYVDEHTEAVLTYAGERGQLADAQKVADVPEEARGMVRVKLLRGPNAPPGQVWVANLRQVNDDGTVRLETVSRDMFEELAMGQGRSSAVELQLPEGIEPPEVAPPSEGVVVYKTEWCGVCKQLLAYLDRKGVQYEAKDIEKDPQAAAELQAKAKQKGVKTGSVPVIDVGGELMVGFDRARLEKLL